MSSEFVDRLALVTPEVLLPGQSTAPIAVLVSWPVPLLLDVIALVGTAPPFVHHTYPNRRSRPTYLLSVMSVYQ